MPKHVLSNFALSDQFACHTIHVATVLTSLLRTFHFVWVQANYMHRLTAFYATNELVVAAVTNGDADGTDVGLTTEVCRDLDHHRIATPSRHSSLRISLDALRSSSNAYYR